MRAGGSHSSLTWLPYPFPPRAHPFICFCFCFLCFCVQAFFLPQATAAMEHNSVPPPRKKKKVACGAQASEMKVVATIKDGTLEVKLPEGTTGFSFCCFCCFFWFFSYIISCFFLQSQKTIPSLFSNGILPRFKMRWERWGQHWRERLQEDQQGQLGVLMLCF